MLWCRYMLGSVPLDPVVAAPRPKSRPIDPGGSWVATFIWLPYVFGAVPTSPPPGYPALPPRKRRRDRSADSEVRRWNCIFEVVSSVRSHISAFHVTSTYQETIVEEPLNVGRQTANQSNLACGGMFAPKQYCSSHARPSSSTTRSSTKGIVSVPFSDLGLSSSGAGSEWSAGCCGRWSCWSCGRYSCCSARPVCRATNVPAVFAMDAAPKIAAIGRTDATTCASTGIATSSWILGLLNCTFCFSENRAQASSHSLLLSCSQLRTSWTTTWCNPCACVTAWKLKWWRRWPWAPGPAPPPPTSWVDEHGMEIAEKDRLLCLRVTHSPSLRIVWFVPWSRYGESLCSHAPTCSTACHCLFFSSCCAFIAAQTRAAEPSAHCQETQRYLQHVIFSWLLGFAIVMTHYNSCELHRTAAFFPAAVFQGSDIIVRRLMGRGSWWCCTQSQQSVHSMNWCAAWSRCVCRRHGSVRVSHASMWVTWLWLDSPWQAFVWLCILIFYLEGMPSVPEACLHLAVPICRLQNFMWQICNAHRPSNASSCLLVMGAWVALLATAWWQRLSWS